jgi:adenosine deaminase
LHVHLEPEERKRRAKGLRFGGHTSKEAFFGAHSLERNDRVGVTVADLRDFLHELHREQAAQGVQYVEARISPRRFLSDGAGWSSVLQATDDVLRSLHRPIVRAILLVNRNSPDPFIARCRAEIERGLPATFVGLDLAGDETRLPDTARFTGLFSTARHAGLGRTVHAGEFHDASGIWRAIDELGAQRIGHAVSATTSPSLLSRLAKDGILVEVSITSNVALGAVPGESAHPAQRLLDAGVPISLNTDVPLHVGTTLQDEYAAAQRLLKVGLADVIRLQRAAYRHAFADRLNQPVEASGGHLPG